MKKLGCVRIYRRYDFHVPNHKAVLFGYSLFQDWHRSLVEAANSAYESKMKAEKAQEEEAKVATAFYHALLSYFIEPGIPTVY